MSEIERNIKESFNEDFCSHLEYHLSKTFGYSSNKDIKWLWCDGVKMPFDESQLAIKNIIATRKIVTGAWIGTDGQGKYGMTIMFGQNSLDKCMRGLSLTDCLPSAESLDWMTIDTQKKTIELELK